MRISNRIKHFNRWWEGRVGQFMHKTASRYDLAYAGFRLGYALGWAVARKRFDKQ